MLAQTDGRMHRERTLTPPPFSPSPPPREEGRGEEAPLFPDQIPSPRLGGARESGVVSSCARVPVMLDFLLSILPVAD